MKKDLEIIKNYIEELESNLRIARGYYEDYKAAFEEGDEIEGLHEEVTGLKYQLKEAAGAW